MERLLEKIKEEVMIVDQSGRIVYCNERLGVKLQYNSKLMKGWAIKKIVKEPKVLLELLAQVQGGEKIELGIENKVGQSLRYCCKVILEVWQEQVVYILMGKVKEGQLEVVPSTYQILDQIPFGVIIKGLDGRYTYSNQAVYTQCQIHKDQLVGKTSYEIWGDKEGYRIDKEDRHVIATQRAKQVETWIKGEQTKLIKVYKIPFYRGNQLAGLIKICKDETLEWLLEHQLDENYKQLLSIGECNYRRESPLDQGFQEVRMEACLLSELGAQGINVVAYDAEKKRCISYFYEGVCKDILEEEGMAYLAEEELRRGMGEERYYGVHPIEASVFANLKERFLARGIQAIGMYPIHYGQVFMGVLILLYDTYKDNLIQESDLDQKVCKRLGVILRQFELSRKLNEELARRRLVEEELEHLLDTVADVIKVVDDAGRIRMVSESFCELVGQPKSEIIGKDYRTWMYTEGTELESREGKKITLNHTTPKGKSMWIEWQVKYNEERRLYICIGMDVTKAKELAEQQKRYEEQIQKEAIRNEFFIKISHEFRTPINMILSSLTLIEQVSKQQVDGVLLEQMWHKTQRILELADHLIDVTEIDTGFAQLQLEDHNIVEVVETLTEHLHRRIKVKRIAWLFDTRMEELMIRCDRTKIERAISSLLTEAVERIVGEGRIQVTVKKEQDQVVIYVKDTGRPARTEDFLIAQSFVGMHSGKVWVQNSSDGDNKVGVKLPLSGK